MQDDTPSKGDVQPMPPVIDIDDQEAFVEAFRKVVDENAKRARTPIASENIAEASVSAQDER